jgi:HSP20 family protein
MKLDLGKWNPFKFNRNGSGGGARAPLQQQQQAGSSQPQMGSVPQVPEPIRAMGDFLRDPFGSLTQLDRWFGDFSDAIFMPRVDVVDDDDALRITAELPGMQRQDVEILVEDDYLILRGEKKLETKNEEKGCYRVERSFGQFQRVIPLPAGVDSERAEARFENGTLSIRLPKASGTRDQARRVEVKDGPAAQGGRSAGAKPA